MKDKKKTYPSAVSIRNRRLFILDCFLRGFSQSFAPNDPHLGRFSVEKKKKSSLWTLLNFFLQKYAKSTFHVLIAVTLFLQLKVSIAKRILLTYLFI